MDCCLAMCPEFSGIWVTATGFMRRCTPMAASQRQRRRAFCFYFVFTWVYTTLLSRHTSLPNIEAAEGGLHSSMLRLSGLLSSLDGQESPANPKNTKKFRRL